MAKYVIIMIAEITEDNWVDAGYVVAGHGDPTADEVADWAKVATSVGSTFISPEVRVVQL